MGYLIFFVEDDKVSAQILEGGNTFVSNNEQTGSNEYF
jgi:hypothetical protein